MLQVSNPLRPESEIETTRLTARQNIVLPLFEELEGPMIEIDIPEADSVEIKWFLDTDDYRKSLSDENTIDDEDLEQTEEGDLPLAKFGVWLFGPERIGDPDTVIRLISDSLVPSGKIYVASECPWPGKILSPGEFGEYSFEELAATLVRAGFVNIQPIVDGPFFRLLEARLERNNAHVALLDAKFALINKDWQYAEEILNSVSDPIETPEAVREYALLVAACHDLAGRTTECIEALSSALEIDPNCARAMCGLGRIAALQGNLTNAMNFFESAFKLSPALVAAHHGRAAVLEAQNKLPEAFAAMKIASDLRPSNDSLLSETIRLGNAAGYLNDAARYLKHRIANTPMTCFQTEIAAQAPVAID